MYALAKTAGKIPSVLTMRMVTTFSGFPTSHDRTVSRYVVKGPASRRAQLGRTKSVRGRTMEPIDEQRVTEMEDACLHMNLNLRFQVSAGGAREVDGGSLVTAVCHQ